MCAPGQRYTFNCPPPTRAGGCPKAANLKISADSECVVLARKNRRRVSDLDATADLLVVQSLRTPRALARARAREIYCAKASPAVFGRETFLNGFKTVRDCSRDFSAVLELKLNKNE